MNYESILEEAVKIQCQKRYMTVHMDETFMVYGEKYSLTKLLKKIRESGATWTAERLEKILRSNDPVEAQTKIIEELRW
jgi:hypothetical protein